MTDSSKLISIGRFSTLSRISVRMLRHYDANDVLIPAAVDEINGYRWYSTEQLAQARRIRQLRDVGFGVSAIGALLAAHGTPAFAQALRIQRQVVADEAFAAKQRLSRIDSLLDDYTEDKIMTHAELIELPAQTLLTLRGRVANYAAEGELWAQFMPALAASGIRPSGPGGCIEHDGEFRESDVEESVFVEVPARSVTAEPLRILDFPERLAVTATVTGPFAEAIPRAHDAIAAYIASHGLRVAHQDDDPATHHFNVYLNDPSQVQPEELLTQVVMPVLP